MKQLATQFVAALLLAMASASVWGNDNNVNLADESDYSVLVFWASWCGRCDAVLKDMDALHMSGALHGIPVKAVNIGAQANAAQALLRKGGQDLQELDRARNVAKVIGPIPKLAKVGPVCRRRMTEVGWTSINPIARRRCIVVVAAIGMSDHQSFCM